MFGKGKISIQILDTRRQHEKNTIILTVRKATQHSMEEGTFIDHSFVILFILVPKPLILRGHQCFVRFRQHLEITTQ